MSSSFIYPEIIGKIRAVCSQHLDGRASADAVQSIVQRAESLIVAIEEKDVRDFLTEVEGRFEEIRFAYDDDMQLVESQKVAQQVLLWLSEREK